jgi:UDP-2-acetamido-3-amino-2,3-dideoxy-glucuronate N-acetyltransferase
MGKAIRTRPTAGSRSPAAYNRAGQPETSREAYEGSPHSPVIDPSARVHASADLEENVSVGAGSSVWHRAQIRRGARIGAECVVGRDVFVDEGVTIGDRTKIQNAALIYHGVTVEDGVFIGPNAILTNDRFPRAITSTGELARAEDWQVMPIVLRHGCSIGAGAVVVAGADVGRFATVGAGAVVTRSVGDHALVAGNPARRLGWVCACGQRLLDARSGEAASATPAGGTALICASCERQYVYIPDAESLEERAPGAIRQGAPA